MVTHVGLLGGLVEWRIFRAEFWGESGASQFGAGGCCPHQTASSRGMENIYLRITPNGEGQFFNYTLNKTGTTLGF